MPDKRGLLHRIQTIFFLLGLLWFSIGCDKDQINTDLFRLHVAVDLKPFHENYWLMIHDLNGNLVGFERIVSGEDIVILAEEKPARINITFVELDRTGSKDFYNVETYLGIGIGEEWFLENTFLPPERNGTLSGTGTVNIENVPGNSRVYLTNKWGYFNGEYFEEETSVMYSNQLYEEAHDLFLCVQPSGGTPAYQIFYDVKDGDNFLTDVADLEEFDHVLDFSFPPTKIVYASVEALSDEPFYERHRTHGFLTSIDWSENSEVTFTNLQLGYLDQFSRYRTDIFVDRYRYTKVGDRPTEINIPDHTISVQDSSIQNFTIITTGPYVWRESFWTRQTNDASVFWEVYGQEKDQLPFQFPDSFLEAHPLLSPDNLEYSGGVFHLQGQTFDEYVATQFKRSIDNYPDYENWIAEY